MRIESEWDCAYVVAAEADHRGAGDDRVFCVWFGFSLGERPVNRVADHAARPSADVGEGGVLGAREGGGPEKRLKGTVVRVHERWRDAGSC